jgi:Carboxypeptidase regulatory-like domain/TonB dependent receptor
VKTAYRGMLWSLILAILVLGLAVSGQVSAQVISGDLVGTVLDKTGAVVPGARVEATKTDTGVKYETKANESGEYRFNNLPVGVYSISASTANFATTTINGFKVELNKTSTLAITLEVKGAVTSIEVSGAAAALDTTTSQLQSTFESKDISDSAIASTGGNGSGVLNLSLLSAGVGTSGGVGVGSGPSVGGQRPRNNNFTIEGVDNNNKGVTGPLVAVPNDAVAEFSLLQNQFSPEFGHSSGGQFNTVVKSGTNSFHGLAYVYNVNRNYDAFDSLNGIGGLTSNPRFDNNRFGGQIGGPVIKNKLFFFVNYEQEPLGQAGTGGAVCSPTAASFAVIDATPGLSATNLGIFEKYVQPGTNASTGCDPINWVGGTTLATEGLAVVAPSFINYRYVVTSMDYDLSSKDQIRGRYIYNSTVGIDNNPTLPAFFTPQPNKFHLVTINEYHTFSPTLTNEVRLGFNRFAQTFDAGNFAFPGLDSFPNLQFNDLGQLQVGPDPNAPQGAIQNTYQLAEAMTWTKNAHTLKFGIEGRKLIAPQNFTQRARGDYEYNDTLSYLQDAVPDYLAERSNGNSIFYGDQSAIYFYVNDNWRIRKNLTLNLGIRYEYTTIPFTQRTQSLNAAASVPGLINFAAPQAAKNNWGPRIGFAYSPGDSGRTSIRAGAGIAYDVLFDNLGLLSLPPQLSSTIDCAPVGGYNCPTAFLAGGGILPGPGGIATFPTIADQRAATAGFVPVDQKSPKSIDWTLGIQHTFWSDFTAEVRYVGTRGIHLPAQIRLNTQSVVTPTNFLPTYTAAPDQATLDGSTLDLNTLENQNPFVPAYDAAGFNGSFLTSYQPWASSTYHGLAAQLNKRFSHGFQMVGAYTYSHLIDDATAEVFSTVLSPRRAQDGLSLNHDFANSILDHRHRFTLSLVYDEPFFKNSNAFLRNTVGGWEIAPIYTYQSGQWVTAQSGIDSNLNLDSAGDRTILNPSGASGTGTGVTPLCTSAVAVCPATVTDALNNPVGVVGYLANNPSARYIEAGYGALANVGRNTLQLKPINDVDLSALKRFVITERFKIEFRASATNVLNHAQYVGGYLNDVQPQNPAFTGFQKNILLPNNSSFNQPSQVFSSNPRTLQLALKIFF